MGYLLALLLFPIIWPFIAKAIWSRDITIKEMLLNIVIVIVLIILAWETTSYVSMLDTEIWNGEILSKHRVHGSYVRSYSCNCTTDSKGNQTCQTCYEDHYTVNWYAKSNINDIQFDYADWTSRGVYSLPDPASYSSCKIGDPVSLERRFKNYVKVASKSLFHLDPNLAVFEKSIPNYPKVFSFYKINRVLNTNSSISQDQINLLNDNLNHGLKELGPKKQANIVVILTGINDHNYKSAVESNWLGGKKNDILVFIGTDADKNITWADASTWAFNSGNEMLQVKLRDSLLESKTFDAETISKIILDSTNNYYKRPHMKDFKYLLDDIEPPMWVFITLLIIGIAGSIGLSIFFIKENVL